VAAGVGVAHFRQTSSAGAETTSNSAVLQYGGGLDFKVVPFISLRGEVRDYYSGLPDYFGGASGRQHNLLVGAGILLHF
jgi:hypothetical protein